MKLSILIPTVVGRETFFDALTKDVKNQIDILKQNNNVEVIYLLDNRQMSIGNKRNKLLQQSVGNFITFIDDDDRISADYIYEVLNVIDKNPDTDCIVFNCICTRKTYDGRGGKQQFCRYGIEYEYTKQEPWTFDNCDRREQMEEWYGKPAHTMVWKSSLAKSCTFTDKNNGEDFDWISQAWPKIKNQVRIDKVLYYYDAVMGKRY